MKRLKHKILIIIALLALLIGASLGMSTHTKKKIIPHTHFSDEVVEAQNVIPLNRAGRGLHAEDVLVDSVLTLDLTTVEWTRHWEIEDFNALDGDSTVVSDGDASDDSAVLRASTDPTDNNIINHENQNIPTGDFNFIVRLKVASNASSSDLVTIGLYSATFGGFFGIRTIHPSDFPSSASYRHFAVRCTVPADYSDIDIVFTSWTTGITDLYADWAGLIPANVPLSESDVSLDPHSGTDTDSHSGSDTDSHSGTDADSHNGTDTNAHSGTSSANGFMNYVQIGTWNNIGSPLTVGTTRDDLCGGTADDISPNSAGLALVVAQIARTGGGPCNVRFIFHDNSDTFTYDAYISSVLTTVEIRMIIPHTLSNKPCRLDAQSASGTVDLQAILTVYEFLKHTHSITQPYDHSVTQAGDHSVTQAGDHSVTQAGDHIVTQPFDHNVTESGHEH